MNGLAWIAIFLCVHTHDPRVRSAASGAWSDPATWEGKRSPIAGDRVQIRAGHVVTFDSKIDAPIRSIQVAGTLRFDPDRDTVLTVGLLKVQSGDDDSETGFDRESMVHEPEAADRLASLEVGTADRPISAGKSALIRLAIVDGLDPEVCPAIVCDGGRMEFHGAPLSRTWVKLGAPASAGDASVTLAEPVIGWNVGDRVIVTSTRHPFARDAARTPHVLDKPETEERIIRAIDGPKLTLDAPLSFHHISSGETRGEVAVLSRNVAIESADPGGVRGHTMYHRGSKGSISFAEFRHLGKAGKLGKYSLHFHKAGDSMRGMSVVGASIWDSANRWITIHGTNSLVIRDCVGYRSAGHGFFLEDGTEVDNILDHNLAVQAIESRPIDGQMLPYDKNEGAGFWWANCGNAFTGNVAAECDGYGFRYEPPPSGFDPVLNVRGPTGKMAAIDVRSVPFLRFENNEAHAQRRHGLKLGGGPDSGEPGPLGGVGPDARHPFVVRGLRVWDSHWAFSPGVPSVIVDDIRITLCDFGFWRPVIDRHAYRKVAIDRTRWPFFAMSGTPPEESQFPRPLDPVDDRAPVTVITRVEATRGGRLVVRGVSVDDVSVRAVRVNGRGAKLGGGAAQDWEVEIDGETAAIVAEAEDASGNVEKAPHSIAAGTGRPRGDFRHRH